MSSSNDPNFNDPRDVHVLHGQYIGSTLSSKGRIKQLHVMAHDQQWSLTLPKAIGYSLSGKLLLGMQLQVWVRPHKQTLRALMVIPVDSAVDGAIASQSGKLDLDDYDRLETLDLIGFDALASKASKQLTLNVCTKGKCYKQGGRDVIHALQAAAQDLNLQSVVVIKKTGCLKNCKKGPTVKITPNSKTYSFVRKQDAAEILQRHTLHTLSESS